MAESKYAPAIQEVERALFSFLRTFEAIQNNMRTERLPEFQAQLQEAAPDGFPALARGLSEVEVPESMRQFHDAFTAGIRHCGNAREAFLNADERNYPLTAMDVRRSLCRGLQVLYSVRAQTPTLADYWLMPWAIAERDTLESPSPDAGAAVGVMHRRRAAPLADYSLYVPESYSPSREWPLIVCLHGAHGRGDHFIWSWLRPAKSRGYMLMAPKSLLTSRGRSCGPGGTSDRWRPCWRRSAASMPLTAAGFTCRDFRTVARSRTCWGWHAMNFSPG